MATSIEAVVTEFKHPLYLTRTEHLTMTGFLLVTQSTLQKMVTSIEVIEFSNRIVKKLTRASKKTKMSWTFMRQNGADSPYCFSIVANLGHT